MQRRGLVVLGATGTIGRLTLEVAERCASRLRVRALAAGRDASGLADLALRHRPEALALADAARADELRARLRGGWDGEILLGPEGVARLARWPDAAVVVNAIVGAAGLTATLEALGAGRRVALANKESLVIAGHLVRRARERGGGEILPVDSEHSALFQCLQGRRPDEIAGVTLTASGGPFRDRAAALDGVRARDALAHPTWRMGRRVTIDSATLFNKGLELIEAHWLFGLPLDRVHAVVHPQSIVHALVELADGSWIAHLAPPDMRLPIQYALSHPERWDAPAPRADLARLGPLTFEAPDEERFPCLRVAREAARLGGTAPAAVNAADEVLVEAFLAGRIAFTAIGRGIETVLRRHAATADPTLEEVLAADRWARREAGGLVDERA